MTSHLQHKSIPGNLEASDEAVEREAGSDVNQVYVDTLHSLHIITYNVVWFDVLCVVILHPPLLLWHDIYVIQRLFIIIMLFII